MVNEYRNNHYVPVWYQKRFMVANQVNRELYYLNLKPGTFTDPRGVVHQRRELKRLGPKFCFRERDLYTTRFGSTDSTELEQFFFGDVDTKGREAVEYFSTFEHPSMSRTAVDALLTYMTVQKLRTPKGLGWLAEEARTNDRNQILRFVHNLQQVFAAMWAECVWLIADASQSETKFIVSDHPVTVYNRRCGPRSQWCRGFRDPDIRYHGSHTIFPLTLEKILIFTNLSWVRNPYQSELGLRPNPNPWRGAIFNFTTIQTLRHLTEEEVRQINFIIKSRAHRYVASAREEWLYPERHVSKADWAAYGHGYLLMPDPRGVTYVSEVFIGHSDRRVSHFDAYGRRPWQREYGREDKDRLEFKKLHRFQGEFAFRFGPQRRGRSFGTMRMDPEVDDDDFHAYHLRLFNKGPRSRTTEKRGRE